MEAYEKVFWWLCTEDVSSATAELASRCGKGSPAVEYAARWLKLIRGELVAEVRDGSAHARRRFAYERRRQQHQKRGGSMMTVGDWKIMMRHPHKDGRSWVASCTPTSTALEDQKAPQYELLVSGTSDFVFALLPLPGRSDDGVRVVFLDDERARPARALPVFSEGSVIECLSVGSALSSVYRARAVSEVDKLSPELRAVICGGNGGSASEWWEKPARPPAASDNVLNAAQEGAVKGVGGCMSVVVGPPGTGKSSFIAALLQRRMPRSERCLCCCTTNKAIDSLVEKLLGCPEIGGVLAVGRLESMGAAARARTVDSLLKADVELRAVRLSVAKARNARERLEEQLITLAKPAGPKVVDGKEQNRGFVERELNKLAQKTKKPAKEPLKKTPAVSRLMGMLDLEVKKSSNMVVQDLIDAATAWLAKPMDGDAERLASRQRLKVELKAAQSLESALEDKEEVANGQAVRRIWRSSRVVCCTAASAATLPLRLARALEAADQDSEEDAFQFVVLDEAGAMLEPDAVAALSQGAKSCVLVGDAKQLPPFAKQRDATRTGYNKSLLERLLAQRSSSVFELREQYRMHPQICGLVSETFYNGSLLTPRSVAAARPLKHAMSFVDFNDHHEHGLESQPESGASYLNEREACAAAAIVEQLIEHGGHHARCVAVLCFYNAQRALVQSKVPSGVLVASVDAVQGRESDAVVVLTTRSNPRGDLGFVSDARRANVALSRARHVCVLLGDGSTLRRDRRVWGPMISSAERSGLLRSYSTPQCFLDFFTKTAPRHYAAEFPPPPIAASLPPDDDFCIDDFLRSESKPVDDADSLLDAALAGLSIAPVSRGIVPGASLAAARAQRSVPPIAPPPPPKDSWDDDDEPPALPPPKDDWEDEEDEDEEDDDEDSESLAALEAKVQRYTKKLEKAKKKGEPADELQRLEKKLKKHTKRLSKAQV